MTAFAQAIESGAFPQNEKYVYAYVCDRMSVRVRTINDVHLPQHCSTHKGCSCCCQRFASSSASGYGFNEVDVDNKTVQEKEDKKAGGHTTKSLNRCFVAL